jgi:succinoglycan biosynthesis transport protein ExoP
MDRRRSKNAATMTHQPTTSHADVELESQSGAHVAHMLLRFLLAVRYRKNVVIAAMTACALLGALYYATATRYYGSKAAMLITQTGPDTLNTSITGEELLRRNTMPTFENVVKSAKVLEGALGKLGESDRVDLAGVPSQRWIDVLQSNIRAKAVRSTNILEIGYRSRDPQVAANVVRAIVDSYLDFMDKIHKGTTGDVARVLARERGDVAGKLARKQEELLEARRRFSDMGFRSDGKTLHPMVQRAVYFNEMLMAVQKQRVELDASLAAVEAAVRNGDDLGQHLLAVGDVVGREVLLAGLGLSARDSNTQASLEQILLSDRAQLRSAERNLGPAHPEMLAVKERIRLTEEFLQGYQNRIQQRMDEMRQGQLGPWLVQMVQQKLEEARHKEEMLEARFEEARTEAIELTGQLGEVEVLERDVKRLSDMNEVLLSQLASLDLKQSGQEVRVAVTQEPVVVPTPVSPRLAYVALVSLAGGFGVGLMLVHLLDALDDRFRSLEEMQNRLGVAVLSMVQQIKSPNATGLEALAMYTAPATAESEAFRTLRTALALTHPDARQIVVSSPEPGDGKTTVLANLAVAYAQADKKTLLIDADLRRPGLTNLMNLRGTTGLSELLRSDGDLAPLAAAHIQPSGMKGLDILPCGPRPSNPAELLGSPRFSQLLAWAETAYDQILVDSPPAMATSDAALIGRLVDGAVLVVQPAKNRRRLVIRLVENLAFLKIPVLGLVVNRVGSSGERGYYGYYSGYGYGYDYGYGSGYGSDEETSGDVKASQITPARRNPRTESEADAAIIPRRVA